MASQRRTRGSLEHDIRVVLAAGREPMTPAQVRDALGGALAYTTVMTVLARLHGKGEVTRQPNGRGYAYAAPRTPAEITAQRMQRLLDADADRAGVLVRFVGTLQAADEHLLRSLLETVVEADETEADATEADATAATEGSGAPAGEDLPSDAEAEEPA